MTARSRVFLPSEDLFVEAHARQLPIEFDNALDLAIVVVEPGLEWACRLPVAKEVAP